jgi:hypothetical protein
MFRQVQPLQLFATQLYAQEIAEAERRPLEQAMRQVLDGAPATDLQRHAAFQPLLRAAEAAGEGVLQRLEATQRGLEAVRLEALVDLPGAGSTARVHANAYLGGLYLLSGGGQWSATDPRPQAHLLTVPLAEPGAATAESLGLPLAPGRLLLFPAFLRHRTLPNPGPGPRIVLSFALSFRDFLERVSPPRWERRT